MAERAESMDFQATVPVVFTRADGDVEVAWMHEGQATTVRTFRAHFGHVVEVVGDRPGQLRRIGRGLRCPAVPLVVDAPLGLVIERALAENPDSTRTHTDTDTPGRGAGVRTQASTDCSEPRPAGARPHPHWLERPLSWLGTALGVRPW
jgi:hypothetical protein